MSPDFFKIIFLPSVSNSLDLDKARHSVMPDLGLICLQRLSADGTSRQRVNKILLDFSLTVKAATLIFISGRGFAISSAKEGKSGFIYNLVKS